MLAQMFKDSFFYIVYFQDVGVAEAGARCRPAPQRALILYSASGDAPPAPGFAGKAKGLGLLDGMNDPAMLPSWLTEADLDYFAAEFERSGFRGGINRYRNMDRDWNELPQLEGARIKQPAPVRLRRARTASIAMNPARHRQHEGATATTCAASSRCRVRATGRSKSGRRRTNAALIEFLKGL